MSTGTSPSRMSISLTIVSSLVQRYVERLDHARPPRAIGLDEFPDSSGIAWTKRRKADFLPGSAECIVVQGQIEACGYLLRDIVRHLSGCRNTIPDADAVIQITALGDGRYIRQLRDAFACADPERAQQPGPDRRQRGADRFEHQLDVTCDQVGQCGPRALVGLLLSGNSTTISMLIGVSCRAVSGTGPGHAR